MLPTLSTNFNIFFYVLLYRQTADVEKLGCVAATSNGLQYQKRQLALFLSNFFDEGVIPKITDVDPTAASTGLFLPFPLFLPQQGFQPHSTVRPLTETCASTRRHCRRDARPRAHPGPPSGHSPYRTVRDIDWHRPSGRWNVAGWVFCRFRRQPGRRRAPTTGGDTM